MKLRGKKRTIEVEIEGATFDVALITRRDESEIAVSAYSRKWDAEAKAAREHFDANAATKEKLRRMLVAARGMTIDWLDRILDLPEHIEIDLPDPQGDEIPLSHTHVVWRETIQVDDPAAKDLNRKKSVEIEWTLPLLLYSWAPIEKFQALVDEAQKRFAELEAEAEKKRSTTSVGSAA